MINVYVDYSTDSHKWRITVTDTQDVIVESDIWTVEKWLTDNKQTHHETNTLKTGIFDEE